MSLLFPKFLWVAQIYCLQRVIASRIISVPCPWSDEGAEPDGSGKCGRDARVCVLTVAQT